MFSWRRAAGVPATFTFNVATSVLDVTTNVDSTKALTVVWA
jgi:hypothetical protein